MSRTRDVVAAVWRIESARIVGALARYTGDVALAEDLAQEALAEALVSWPRDGVPDNPAAWLTTVGRRRAIDTFRRRSALDTRYASLAHDLDTDPGDGADVLFDPDRIDDDVLALMFVSCHPVLSADARVALTLRVVGGLTSDEIARAFLVPTATVQARITRAKKALASADVAFEVPVGEERRARLGSVLSAIYVIYTEGSTATSGDDLVSAGGRVLSVVGRGTDLAAARAASYAGVAKIRLDGSHHRSDIALAAERGEVTVP